LTTCKNVTIGFLGAPSPDAIVTFLQVVKDPYYRPAIIAVVGVMVAQQLTGMSIRHNFRPMRSGSGEHASVITRLTADIIIVSSAAPKKPIVTFLQVVKDPYYRPAIIAVVGVMVAQQLTGTRILPRPMQVHLRSSSPQSPLQCRHLYHGSAAGLGALETHTGCGRNHRCSRAFGAVLGTRKSFMARRTPCFTPEVSQGLCQQNTDIGHNLGEGTEEASGTGRSDL
jgi:hypothetical protein